jgi:hypothetical protein
MGYATEEQFQELSGKIKEIGLQLGGLITEQRAAKADGESTKDLEIKIGKLIDQQNALEAKLAETGDLAQLAKLDQRVKGLERTPSRTKSGPKRRKTKGQRARELAAEIIGSKTLAEFRDKKDVKSESGILVVKAADPLTTDDAAEDGDRDPEWVVEPAKVTRLRDLIPNLPTDKKNCEYIRQDKYYYIYTHAITGVVVPAATPTAVEVDNAEAYKVGALIYKGDDEALPATITAVDRDSTPNTITVNSAPGYTVSVDDRLWSKEFIWTREAKPKPYGKITYPVISEPVRLIGTVHPVTEEALEDEPDLASQIENQVMPDMVFKEERQFFYGTGTNGEMTGFMNDADIPEYFWSNGSVGDTMFDALWRGRGIARLNNSAVGAVCISVEDNTELAIVKGEDGHYITKLTMDADGNVMGMGMTFLECDALDAGDALLGSFSSGAKIRDRTGIEVKFFTETTDAAIEGVIWIRFRQRTILLIMRPKSFVRVRLDNEPVAP